MNWPFALGRVLLVVVFIVSGVEQLKNRSAAGQIAQIGEKYTFPAAVTDAANKIVETVGLPVSDVLAMVVGAIAVGAALLIAFNIATRTMAVVLFVYTLVATFFVHNFWTMQGLEFTNNMYSALKNLAIMGALLMLAAWPRRVMHESPAYERASHQRDEAM